MLTCPTCGTQAQPGGRICDTCGAPLLAAPRPPLSPPGAADPNPHLTTPFADHPPGGYVTPPNNNPSAGYPPLSFYAPVAGGGRFTISRWPWLIGGSVLALIIVIAVVLNFHGSSLSGEWYGPISVTAVALTVPDGAIYLDLRQAGDGGITGSGAACLLTGNGGADLSVTGQASNSTITLAIGPLIQPGSFDQFTGTWSGQSLQLTSVLAGGSGTITLKLSHDSRSDYDTACQNPTATD